MIEHDVADHAILHIIGEQTGNGRIGRHKIGAAADQIGPKQHAGFAVGHGVRLVKDRLVSDGDGVTHRTYQAGGQHQPHRHVIDLIDGGGVGYVNDLHRPFAPEQYAGDQHEGGDPLERGHQIVGAHIGDGGDDHRQDGGHLDEVNPVSAGLGKRRHGIERVSKPCPAADGVDSVHYDPAPPNR